ncbi:MAG TPA: PBP1A family penicillin-binding protein [Vicinamibacterales bacterium]|nr:PBP1A family penicillin-binding protein [Vicinamibacterales bacterium]
MPRIAIRYARRAGLVVLFLVVATAGAASGLLFAYAEDLPQISALDDYAPSVGTRIYAGGGEVIGEFATEQRVVVSYDDIAPVLRQAIIASEDGDFEQHFGLSFSRILITAIRDILYGQRYGASTITQQAARMLFLQSEYMRGGVYARRGYEGFERKVKEALLALQLEKRYTKREIFAFYANTVPLGHGVYGVEAGAWLYFRKSARDVTLDEAATLAAIVQTPSRLSPYVNPDQTLARRNNVVLRRMVNEGFITEEQAREAAAKPLRLRGQPTREGSLAPYFVEEVRQVLEAKYGSDAVYRAGLRVETSLDLGLQLAAEKALDEGLRRLDKRKGWRKPESNVIEKGQDPAAYRHSRWSRPVSVGDIVPAVVTASPAEGTPDAITLRIGDIEATLPRSGYAWTRQKSTSFLKPGDLVDVRIEEIDGETRTAVVALEQRPAVQGAVVAIDNHTGQIKVMVGGHDFSRSKFNRAVQAFRQLGSTFKPIVYTAAIDRGYTPVSILLDEPEAFDAGPRQPPYTPQNYDRTFRGPITLRHSLEHSRNVTTVRLLRDLGVDVVIDYARRMGMTNPLPPYLSLALGAAEGTLLETTSAYTVFPNQGVRMRPYFVLQVLDREGNVLEENRPEAHEAIRADTAYIMTSLLRGVTIRGTAAAANALRWPIAGKTGTVDDYTDAWFIGFDPDITVGVWVGYDQKKPLGPGATGAEAALPIWMDIMRAYLERRGRDNMPEFAAPGNIVFLAVDRDTGLPTSDATHAINEAFIAGTEPRVRQMD